MRWFRPKGARTASLPIHSVRDGLGSRRLSGRHVPHPGDLPARLAGRFHSHQQRHSGEHRSNEDETLFFHCGGVGLFSGARGRARSRAAGGRSFRSRRWREYQETDRARAIEASGIPSAGDEARNIIARSLEHDAEALSSVLMLAPDDKALATKVERSGRSIERNVVTADRRVERAAKRQAGRIHSGSPERSRKSQKPRNPKEASRPRSVTADFGRVPTRKVSGPMNVYYYDYVADRASGEDLRPIERIARGRTAKSCSTRF